MKVLVFFTTAIVVAAVVYGVAGGFNQCGLGIAQGGACRAIQLITVICGLLGGLVGVKVLSEIKKRGDKGGP